MPQTNASLNTLLNILADMQAIDVKVIDVRSQTTITDYMIIGGGRSSRHVKAIASDAVEKMKKAGVPPLSQTGLDLGEWALVDFGDFVVHIMLAETRSFYNLEGLWQDNAL